MDCSRTLMMRLQDYARHDSQLPTLIGQKQFRLLANTFNRVSPLGKFDEKSDEGFLVGYSVNSKAFRVYNLVTKRVEVNLHVNFLEEKPNVQGIGHRWMFDLDYLTDSMNYIPVSVHNQANPAGSKEVIDIDVQTEEAAELMVITSTSLTEATRKAAVSEEIATKKTHSPKLDALALKHLGPVSATEPTSTNPVNTGSINLNTAFEKVNTGNTEAISPSADHEEEVFSDADDDEMPEIRIYDKFKKSPQKPEMEAGFEAMQEYTVCSSRSTSMGIWLITQCAKVIDKRMGLTMMRFLLPVARIEAIRSMSQLPHWFVDPDHPNKGNFNDFSLNAVKRSSSTQGNPQQVLSISWSKLISWQCKNRHCQPLQQLKLNKLLLQIAVDQGNGQIGQEHLLKHKPNQYLHLHLFRHQQPTPTRIPPSTSPPPLYSSPTPTPIPTPTSPLHHHLRRNLQQMSTSMRRQSLSTITSHITSTAPSHMPADELLQTVPKLITRIDSLELDLKQTKLTMGNAIVKLVKKVKKLEGFLKRRNLVLTDSEDEEPEVQGRKSQADPQDSSKQGLVTPPTTKAHAFKGRTREEINPTLLKQPNSLQMFAIFKVKIILVLRRLILLVRHTAGEDKGQREGKAPMLSKETPKKSKDRSNRKKQPMQKHNDGFLTKRRGG
ncbi:hypothetical protein Tco_0769251 [Tanacetum coccineum]|uniref:Retroviral polymerase SH3-like domain-containing protein n=1 Tax=Tanacetum coccineum TaxID=301880 RepID=A0ABQ4Z9W2_9ASTR